MISEKLRKSGIPVIGDVPWGTHFCQFYQTREDLIDILVPYFKVGLENNEYCMWITAEPLNVQDAVDAMRKVVPDFDQYVRKRQIEIIPYTKWYIKEGSFDGQTVLQGWVDRLNQALINGYDGLRLTGNTFWLEKTDWKDFTDYEEEVNNVIGKYRMMAICTYSLEKCGASEVIDVVVNHQFALIKREGEWDIIESSISRQKTDKIDYLEGLVEQRNMELLEAQRIAHMGNWYWDIISNELKWSDEIYRIFGLLPQQFSATYDAFLQIVHPDDRQAVQKGVDEALYKNIPYSIDHRLILPDGSERSVHEQAQVYFDGSGRPVRMIGTVQDITERKQAEDKQKRLNEELVEYSRQLEATNSELSAFVYSASHVLRAPLRGINGYSRILLDDFTDSLNDDGKRLLNAVARNAAEMGHYIDDLLAYSNAGRMKMEPSFIDMNKAVESVVEELQPLLSVRDVKFEIKMLPPAYGDQPMVRRVFHNLLSNAVKFTMPKQAAVIEIGGRLEERESVYYVKDNGAGFDPRYKDKLFGVFQRLHEDEEFDGTGMGLAIVKRIIEKHGGRVWAEGKVNEGATFYFTLPKTY